MYKGPNVISYNIYKIILLIMFNLMEQVYLRIQTRIEKDHDLTVTTGIIKISEELNGQIDRNCIFNKQHCCT